MTFDINLVIAAQQGDTEAFAELYSQIQNDIYRFALYSLGNCTDAEDAVSDTFTEAFKSIKKLRSPESFKNWIFKILSIQCNKRIKRYIFERESGGITFDEVADKLSYDSEDIGIEKLALMQALDTLSAADRMIVLLYTVHGYTVKEVAKILRRPVGTVSSKLYRSLDKLKKTLETGENI